jgi:hypothetical protein
MVLLAPILDLIDASVINWLMSGLRRFALLIAISFRRCSDCALATDSACCRF